MADALFIPDGKTSLRSEAFAIFDRSAERPPFALQTRTDCGQGIKNISTTFVIDIFLVLPTGICRFPQVGTLGKYIRLSANIDERGSLLGSK